ncbi:hypothetical protein EVAR_49702_1 [Eumeta japonica]|uniref:Uncharacterized protein n=1 Tax=Eumeta variegata TaxID=151549 RepID=A0A4C1Z4Z3_EUMVA|nr:hypothetical protein EVAR_49702_1 [Eumeta japonica]
MNIIHSCRTHAALRQRRGEAPTKHPLSAARREPAATKTCARSQCRFHVLISLGMKASYHCYHVTPVSSNAHDGRLQGNTISENASREREHETVFFLKRSALSAEVD